MRLLIVMLLGAAVSGCSTLAAVKNKGVSAVAATVTDYCANITPAERTAFESSVNEKAAPHAVNVKCEGDPVPKQQEGDLNQG